MTGLSATKELQQRFWTGFAGALPSDGRLNCSPWDANMAHAVNVAEGQDFELTLRFNVRDRRIEVDLTLKGAKAKTHISALRASFHSQSERALGPGLEWQPEVPVRPAYPRPRLPEAHVRIKRRNINPQQEESWPEYWAWLISQALVLDGWRRTVGIA